MTDWNRAQPGPVALWHFIHANFPTTRNLGIYNHRVVAGTHTLSHHAEGRALDIGLLVRNPNEKVLGDNLFRIFGSTTASLLRKLDEIILEDQHHIEQCTNRPRRIAMAGADPHNRTPISIYGSTRARQPEHADASPNSWCGFWDFADQSRRASDSRLAAQANVLVWTLRMLTTKSNNVRCVGATRSRAGAVRRSA